MLERGGQHDRESVPVLPATMYSGHLAHCAAGLAADPVASVGTLHDLAVVVRDLVDTQRLLSTVLAGLGEHLVDTADPAVAPDLAALADILFAAGQAASHTADALAEGTSIAADAAGGSGSNTRL